MKNSIHYILIVLILFLPVILYIRLIEDEEDNRKIAEIEKIENEKHFEEIEKRLRLLEQDDYILKYGFEREEKSKWKRVSVNHAVIMKLKTE